VLERLAGGANAADAAVAAQLTEALLPLLGGGGGGGRGGGGGGGRAGRGGAADTAALRVLGVLAALWAQLAAAAGAGARPARCGWLPCVGSSVSVQQRPDRPVIKDRHVAGVGKWRLTSGMLSAEPWAQPAVAAGLDYSRACGSVPGCTRHPLSF